MAKLNAKRVEALKEPGFYGDGEGLYLKVGVAGAKSWILRTVVHGRRRDLGLGSASLVALSEARAKARHFRKIARDGGDPDATRKQESLTFEQAARRVYEQLLPTWRNAKHAETWIATVERYAGSRLGKRPLPTIGTADILEVLTPIWTEKHETAKRLKQRLATIFDWAKGAGQYPHENPVNGVKKALPAVKKRTNHLAAMPWQEVPDLMRELVQRNAVSARTLEFVILTAARSGEARGARWSEFDLTSKVWTIPADRMKRGVIHRVPLSEAAIAVLEKVKGLDTELVFPSVQRAKSGISKPQSGMVFKALLNRMQREGFTVHGFRSSFRDWCGESARADREVAEAALAHTLGNEVERAYARSDLFDRRVTLMQAWGQFVSGAHGNVAHLVRA
ncbi:tyrosine-type recombinase/integrase [Marimonas arenosa]|uniref:Tyrosine-type recombinase/integrase n=1 Tax=Marimonas arenosa TaxID=1795305 RepID=A0AAE4B409_9RHOB|nr:site-specific integrase [Marimonas arenosa]MDQ2089752.1 tyrosine-type recombinase/integrase [Marimonas arenosa]